jgi:cyclopropane fatty-acyl-phospholipid synthase-like methyltransferase
MTAVAQEYSKYQRQNVTELPARHALGSDYCGQTSSARYADIQAKISSLGLQAGSSVLDAGCGNGCFALRVAKDFGCRVTGVDTSEQVITEATKAAASENLSERVTFQVKDFTNLDGVASGTFDLVMCIGSLYWNPGTESTLRLWQEKLRPGGRLLVYSNMQATALSSEEQSSVGNTKFIDYFAFIESLKTAGFSLGEVFDQTDEYVRWIRKWCEGLEIHKEAMEKTMGVDEFRKFTDRFGTYRLLAEAGKVRRYVLTAIKTS